MNDESVFQICKGCGVSFKGEPPWPLVHDND